RRRDSRRPRDLDAETRTLAWLGIYAHRMLEQRRESANDRQSQAHALAAVAPRIADLIELIEDTLALGCRNADARVPYLNHQSSAASPRADDHAAARSVAHRIRGKIGQDALEEHRVAVDPRTRGNHSETQALRRGRRAEFALQPLEDGGERKRGASRCDRARIELGDVHQ